MREAGPCRWRATRLSAPGAPCSNKELISKSIETWSHDMWARIATEDEVRDRNFSAFERVVSTDPTRLATGPKNPSGRRWCWP
jgi:hypothetical protein